MATALADRPATIRTEQGHRWWCCPSCDRILGEIVGDRLVIRRRALSGEFPAIGSRQACPRCGVRSVYAPDGMMIR